MKPIEDRRKIDENRRRRAERARRNAAESQHPSNRGERDPAPVIPLRPTKEDRGNEAS